jgi:hypothetical protein
MLSKLRNWKLRDSDSHARSRINVRRLVRGMQRNINLHAYAELEHHRHG